MTTKKHASKKPSASKQPATGPSRAQMVKCVQEYASCIGDAIAEHSRKTGIPIKNLTGIVWFPQTQRSDFDPRFGAMETPVDVMQMSLEMPENASGVMVMVTVTSAYDPRAFFNMPLWLDRSAFSNPLTHRPALIRVKPAKTLEKETDFDPCIRARVDPTNTTDKEIAVDVTFRLMMYVDKNKRIVSINNTSIGDCEGDEDPYGGVSDLPLRLDGSMGLWKGRGHVRWLADPREADHQIVAAINRELVSFTTPTPINTNNTRPDGTQPS